MNPTIKDHWNQFKVYSNKYFNNVLSIINEVTFKAAQFIQSNIST